MAPHSGVGGLTPNPRKDSPEISSRTIPRSKVTSTTIGVKMLGSTWRAMTRSDDAPEARAEQPENRHGQQERREGEQKVHDPTDGHVEDPAPVADDQPDQCADSADEDTGHHGGADRYAAAVEQPGQHVAAKVV